MRNSPYPTRRWACHSSPHAPLSQQFSVMIDRTPAHPRLFLQAGCQGLLPDCAPRFHLLVPSTDTKGQRIRCTCAQTTRITPNDDTRALAAPRRPLGSLQVRAPPNIFAPSPLERYFSSSSVPGALFAPESLLNLRSVISPNIGYKARHQTCIQVSQSLQRLGTSLSVDIICI